ncbi:MAG: helix-turn-helix domain-containing protein [Sphingomonas sp.]|uniref:MerR family transcriptional regulator n=1 Tax=Sphingomonas sp. TaxID=28214 RepID=UPI001AC17D21|nr:helix-turn-helix domain-containing protein [Sphingomonas sp.]MBN8815975.1 helix-turn-helix domain-containing protein [Sphingomonas sp.]
MSFAAADHPLKRGALARRFGCNIETIRYYENIALLAAPERTSGGHRVYSQGDQARLGFILRARELGFSVDELRSLLSLSDSRVYTCGEVLAVTERHLDDIGRKISDLRRLQRTLADMSARCAGGDVPECPIMDALVAAV